MSHSLSEIQPPGFDVRLLMPEGERCIQVSAQQDIWDTALAAGIVLPALCHQGRCLTCAGKIEGPGEVNQSASVSYYPEDRDAGFVLLCTGKPRSAVRIRTHQAEAMRAFRRSKGLPAPYS